MTLTSELEHKKYFQQKTKQHEHKDSLEKDDK